MSDTHDNQSETSTNPDISDVIQNWQTEQAEPFADFEGEGTPSVEETGTREEQSKPPTSSIEKSRAARTEREARRAAKEAETQRAEAARLKAELDEMKSNRWKAVGGRDGAEELIKGVLEGKYEEANLSPEERETRKTRSELDEIKGELQRLKEERERQLQEHQQQQDLQFIGTSLDEHADDFPVLHAVGERWAKGEALRRAYRHLEETGEQPDMREIFAELQETVLDDVVPLLDNERALRHLLKDPKRRDIVQRALRSGSAPTGRIAPQRPTTITAGDKAEVISRYTSDESDEERNERRLMDYVRQQKALLSDGF